MGALDLGHSNLDKHKIELTDYTPIKNRYQHIPPHQYKEVWKHLKEMLNVENHPVICKSKTVFYVHSDMENNIPFRFKPHAHITFFCTTFPTILKWVVYSFMFTHYIRKCKKKINDATDKNGLKDITCEQDFMRTSCVAKVSPIHFNQVTNKIHYY